MRGLGPERMEDRAEQRCQMVGEAYRNLYGDEKSGPRQGTNQGTYPRICKDLLRGKRDAQVT